jgi:hypothetical protein
MVRRRLWNGGISGVPVSFLRHEVEGWMREPVVENKAETGIKHHFLRAPRLACDEANTRR